MNSRNRNQPDQWSAVQSEHDRLAKEIIAGWALRIGALKGLVRDYSTKGYVKKWLLAAYPRENREAWPKYLQEYVEEYEKCTKRTR